jgi:hypothetical protein
MGAPKAGGRKRKVYPRGVIVPSKCRARKAKVGKKVGTGGPLPQKPGFVVQDAAGNQFLMNDWPATGGPWGPAVTAAGVFVWVNEGGG